MQADHQSNPHQEEHDLYEHPLESDTTCDDIVAGEYPKGQANYHDPSTRTNNMINQQQQQQFQSTTPFPPAHNPGATQLYPLPPPQQNQGNVNIPGGMYPPQAQQPPQMYPPNQGNANISGGMYPPQAQQPPQMYQPPQQNQGNVNISGGLYPPQTQQQPQMYPPPAGTYPPPQVCEQQQQYQQPVQFPPANPLPQVYQQPISDAPLIVQHQFNETITEGIPIQQQQKTYPSGTPTVGSRHTPSAKTPTGFEPQWLDHVLACLTAWMTPLTIAEMVDNSESSCGGCAIMYVLVGYFTGWEENRKRMRMKKQQAQEMVAPKNQSMTQ